jgi:GNAT superfamily N-acetyltransferase
MARNDKSGPDIIRGIPPHDQLPGTAPLRLSRLSHKVQRNLEDYGWQITIKKTLAYLVRWAYFQQVYRIYRINLDAIQAPDYSGRQEFTFKLLTSQNVDMIAQVENTAEWLRGHVKERIAVGQLCLVALNGEKVAGFNLVNLEQASLILVNRKKKLRPGSAWSEHIVVQKEFRKSGLGVQLRNRIFEALKGRGIRKLYGGTLQSNTASLKLSRSVGFKEICDIHYRKLLTFESWRFKRVRENPSSANR